MDFTLVKNYYKFFNDEMSTSMNVNTKNHTRTHEKKMRKMIE